MQLSTEFKGGPRKLSRDLLHVAINDKGVLLLNHKAWEPSANLLPSYYFSTRQTT
ncbi:MAG: hypothetical protein ABIV48_12865 [Pyrinomonadaceae bacterium]